MKKLIIFLFALSTNSAFATNWECLNNAWNGCNTWRMPVFNGWVVASDNTAKGGEDGYSMVFVPDEKHEWRVQQ